MNYIWHWTEESFYKNYKSGDMIKRWKSWVAKDFTYKNINDANEELGVTDYEIFDGEPEEAKSLLRCHLFKDFLRVLFITCYRG